MKTRLFILVVCLLALVIPAMCQDQPSPKYVFFGLGADGQSSPQLLGMGGLGIPMSNSTLWYTDYDVSVIPGTTVRTILAPNAIQFSTRTGLAQRVMQIDINGRKISILGLVAAGIGAGPGYPEKVNTGADSLVEQQTITKASFAYGGMVDFPLGKGWGITAILQQEKNVAPDGFRFIPRVAVRYALK